MTKQDEIDSSWNDLFHAIQEFNSIDLYYWDLEDSYFDDIPSFEEVWESRKN